MGSAAVSAADETSGQRVGRYTIVRRLAVGGMAELYLARATGAAGFEKAVALKKIRPHLASEPRFVEMFLREARMAAMLEHPNVVHVSDLGESSGDYFIAMEYLHGRDLSSILRRCNELRRWLPWRCALLIATGVAAGLHYAHEKMGQDGKPLGLVHRDISPSNIFITYDGAVKILDFGIARAAAQTSVTQEGTRKGKVPYMSPEQCQSSMVDRRSDLFSLGIVLYEMTTITRLFYGDNEFATMNRIVTKDVEPPSTRIEGYPPLLEEVVLKALTRDPAKRYQSGLEMQLELEHAATELGLVGSARELGAFVAEICGREPAPSLDLGPTRVTSASPPSLSTNVAAHPNPAATDETVVETRAAIPAQTKPAAVGLFLAAGIGMLALSGVAGYLVARGNWGEETPAAVDNDEEKAIAADDEAEPEPGPDKEAAPDPVVEPPQPPVEETKEAPVEEPEQPPVDETTVDESGDPPDAATDVAPEETTKPGRKSGRKPRKSSSKPKEAKPSSKDPKDDIQMRGSSPGSVGGKLEELKDVK